MADPDVRDRGSEQLNVSDQKFRYIDSKTIDDKHRVSLGKKIHKYIQDMAAGQSVDVYINSEGYILLRPMVQIPANAAGMWQNTEVKASFARAFDDLQASRTTVVDDIDEFVDQL